MPNRLANAIGTSVILGAIFLFFAPFAEANVALNVKSGVSVPVASPQDDIFDAGSGTALKMFFPLSRHWDIGPSAMFVNYPVLKNPKVELSGKNGNGFAFGGGPRFKESLWNLDAWLDADILYIKTGKLDRPGFAGTVGLAMPIARAFKIGPFANYFQIVQENNKSGFDNRDARLFTFGLNAEFKFGGSEIERKTELRSSTIICEFGDPADRDGDGIKNDIDKCPDAFGLLENGGCPAHDGLTVKSDEIELSEKIQFNYDSAFIKPESYPILSQIGCAIMDYESIHIEIQGHASAEGTDEYNLNLSERRAISVREYLIAYGVEPERLTAKGFGESKPITDNATETGRALNRRVEFKIDSAATKGGEK